MLARLDVSLDVADPARGLTLAQQQTVEIAKAISLNVRVLIMDEPTASLSAHEVDQLFRIIAALRRQGVAILFISHRMEEVFQIADRVTVLRDGRWISTTPAGELTPRERHPGHGRPRGAGAVQAARSRIRARCVLSVQGLAREGAFRDVSFELRAGEVLGFAGLVGARRTDVGLALFGIAPADTGTILLDGQPITVRSPQDAVRLGIAYTTEDRRQLGLVFPLSIAANISLPSLPRFLTGAGLVRRDAGARDRRALPRAAAHPRAVGGHARSRRCRAATSRRSCSASGWRRGRGCSSSTSRPGASTSAPRWRSTSWWTSWSQEGMAIILISSDLPEVLAMSDRILVMREGRQMAIVDRAEATQERLLAAAMGQEASSWTTGAGSAATLDRPDVRGAAGMMDAVLRRVRPDQVRELTLVLVIIVLMLAFFAARSRTTSTPRTSTDITTGRPSSRSSPWARCWCVLTRNIDLSVGSIVGLVAYVIGTLLDRLDVTCTRCSWSAVAMLLGAAWAPSTALHRGVRAGARDHRHAGHARPVPGGAGRDLGGQDRDHRGRCPTGWSTSRRRPSSASATTTCACMFGDRARGRHRRPARAALPALRSAAVSPSAPTPTRPAWPACPVQRDVFLAFVGVRRAGRPRRGSCSWSGSATSRSPPARAWSSR